MTYQLINLNFSHYSSHHQDMFGLSIKIWQYIAIDNPTTYYTLLQVSTIFKLDTDTMKSKFIRKTIVNDITQYRLPNGWLHSCNDQPAVILADGSQCWYSHGKRHRDTIDYCGGATNCDSITNCSSTTKPAIIDAKGNQYWYSHGRRHRDNDQPAVMYTSGGQCWYINDKLHRDDDKPAIIDAKGNQFWYSCGKRHRDNLPAAIFITGDVFWYNCDKIQISRDRLLKEHLANEDECGDCIIM